MWLKYRARLGAPLQLSVFTLVAALFYVVFVLGGVGAIVKVILGRPELLGWVGALLLLSLLLPWVWGVAQACRQMGREGVHADAEWLRAIVDVERWAIRAHARFEPQGGSFLGRYSWLLLGLGLNLPLMLELSGSDGNYAIFLAVPALLYLGWTCAAMLRRMQAYMMGLHLVELRSGRPLLAAHEDELNALRRGFWFSRWLCGPLPEVAAPVPNPKMRTARRGPR